jgi:predicted HicB family RNase H-like nuclease
MEREKPKNLACHPDLHARLKIAAAHARVDLHIWVARALEAALARTAKKGRA